MDITCGIALFNKANELLICRVTNSDDMWSIPKGLKDPGETTLEATIRELYEETSIKLDLEKNYVYMLGEEKYKKRNKKLVMYVCKDYEHDGSKLDCISLVEIDDNPKSSFKEVDDYKWVSLDSKYIERLHVTQRFLLKFLSNMTEQKNSSAHIS